MLAVQKGRVGEEKCTPNILPCRINHTGPTRVTKRFWKPSVESDGSKISYFRGRKLKGRTVKLPAGYEGVLWKTTDKTLPQQPSKIPIDLYGDEDCSEGEEEATFEAVKVVEQISIFDDIVVWGHDQLPPESDSFVKGVQEWIQFAEAIHRPLLSDAAPTTEKPDS